MTSIKTILAGMALAAGLGSVAGTAGAQPRLEQTGDGYSVVYEGAAERGNTAGGGGTARMLGGGDNATMLYTGPEPARPGRFATLSGGGDNAVLSHAEPSSAPGAAPAPVLAGGAAVSGRRG